MTGISTLILSEVYFMTVFEIILLAVIWHFFGLVILAYFWLFCEKYAVLVAVNGLEFLNPKFIRECTDFSWLKACLLTGFYTVLIPGYAIYYWLYELYSVIRRK